MTPRTEVRRDARSSGSEARARCRCMCSGEWPETIVSLKDCELLRPHAALRRCRPPLATRRASPLPPWAGRHQAVTHASKVQVASQRQSFACNSISTVNPQSPRSTLAPRALSYVSHTHMRQLHFTTSAVSSFGALVGSCSTCSLFESLRRGRLQLSHLSRTSPLLPCSCGD